MGHLRVTPENTSMWRRQATETGWPCCGKSFGSWYSWSLSSWFTTTAKMVAVLVSIVSWQSVVIWMRVVPTGMYISIIGPGISFIFFLYLHFKCYSLSWFPLQKHPIPSFLPLLTSSPTSSSMCCHSPTLDHLALSGPRASPPIDVSQGHPLLHMQLEPWVPPCVLFGWWFSPWELWEYWLVHIVLPMGLQAPSAPSVLSLAPPLGTLSSVQWLDESMHLWFCQALAEPLRRQLYQAPVSKHLLASTIVSEFVDYIWDGSPGGAVSGWSLLHSLLQTLSLYLLPWVFCSTF